MTRQTSDRRVTHALGVTVFVLVAFLGSYGVASAVQSGRSTSAGESTPGPGVRAAVAGEQIACACCGGESEPVEGSTTLYEGVQRIDVDLSVGYYQPNIISAKAGVPVEITFGQGDGCLAEVVFEDFGIREDLTLGSKTVSLPALAPGEYGFSCGMSMVFGTLVVE